MQSGWQRWWRRARSEWRDCVELVLLPGLSVLLPWRWCFPVYRFMARRQFLYRHPSQQALAQAMRHDPGLTDPAQWLWLRKLVTLTDHADHYLARTRSASWWAAHTDVDGHWPAANQPALVITFHWGAGMGSLALQSAHGLAVHALAARPLRAQFQGQWVRWRYACARMHSIVRLTGRPFLDVSTSLRPALQALNHHEQVLALVDVPHDQVGNTAPLQFRGHTVQVPLSLFRLAVNRKLPVVVYLMGFRPEDGRRTLRIRQIPEHTDVPTLVAGVFSELERAMDTCPAAWHFWGEATRFFAPLPAPAVSRP